MPDEQIDDDAMVTTAEAQRLTQYHPDYLRWLARTGAVRAEKRYGLVWRYDRADLLRHQAAARPGPKKWRQD